MSTNQSLPNLLFISLGVSRQASIDIKTAIIQKVRRPGANPIEFSSLNVGAVVGMSNFYFSVSGVDTWKSAAKKYLRIKTKSCQNFRRIFQPKTFRVKSRPKLFNKIDLRN
jgi:hypothetical protein